MKELRTEGINRIQYKGTKMYNELNNYHKLSET